MKITVCTSYYPNSFKPYYDYQFADFIDKGHEVRILARGAWSEAVAEICREYRLPERTYRYPTTLRTIPSTLLSTLQRCLHAPDVVYRSVRRVFGRRRRSFKNTAMDALRSLVLPDSPPDLVLIHNAETARYFSFLPDLFPRTPVCLYYHGGTTPSQDSINYGGVFDYPDIVFTNTGYSADEAVDRGCDPEKIEVVPVGLPIARYPFPHNKNLSSFPDLKLVSVSRLSEEKGLHIALEAIRRLLTEGLEVTYRIVGDGPDRDRLEDTASDLNLMEPGVVTFAGPLPHDDVMRVLKQSDVLLLPSIPTADCQENQGVVLQEAMLMKCIPIASEIGGVPESVAPSIRRRFLVPPGDAHSIEEAVLALLELPKAQRHQLLGKCREFVTDNYDVRDTNEALLNTATARRYH